MYNTISYEDTQIPKFRSSTSLDYPNQGSLRIFKKFFFILEIITLDISSLQFRECLICTSVIYLCLLIEMGFLNSNFIFNNLTSDINVLSNFYDFNLFFNEFISRITDFNFNDLIPIINFVSRYFEVSENEYTMINLNENNNKSIEDYLQNQTNNENLAIAYQSIYPSFKVYRK